MRGIRLLLSTAATLCACAPTGVGDVETVDLTLQLRLAGGHDVGPTPARVYVISDSEPVPRGIARPGDGEECVLATTPLTTCTFAVPRRGPISLIVAEPEPAVTVRFTPASPEDTVRDGRYVEFTGWTTCPEATERGHCVVRPRESQMIEGNFQLMQQVSVYQTGAARMDWVTFAAVPTLRVPAQGYNIPTSPDAGACSIRPPHHAIPSDWLGTNRIIDSPRTCHARRSSECFRFRDFSPNSSDGTATAS
jgi:hypothetical protein